MMSKLEVIERLKLLRYDCDEYCKHWVENDDCWKCDEAFERAIEAINHEEKWIPVTERLPVEEGEYLVTVNIIDGRPHCYIVRWANNLHKVDKYDFPFAKRKGWYYYDDEWGYCEKTNVTAWMPSPEPYRESEE